MGTVIDLRAWRERRDDDEGAEADQSDAELERLEAAVHELQAEVRRWRERAPRARHAEVETELLAIIGAVGLGSIATATERAQRLRASLRAPTQTRGRRPSA
jgi:hypothetical protein